MIQYVLTKFCTDVVDLAILNKVSGLTILQVDSNQKYEVFYYVLSDLDQ